MYAPYCPCPLPPAAQHLAFTYLFDNTTDMSANIVRVDPSLCQACASANLPLFVPSLCLACACASACASA